MALPRDRDIFLATNKALELPHTQAGSIRKALLAVEDCLVINKDNLRGFFEKCFPNLLKRIFGYGDFEASWLNVVTKPGREVDAKALEGFLSPQGKLFAAVASADADRLIQYIFPTERLPAHTQELLRTAAGRRLLEGWPQYRGRVRLDAAGRPQVYLNVFEYFMFWTAFYVLRGSRGPESDRPDQRALLHSGSSYMSMQGIRNVGIGMAGAWGVPVPGLSRVSQVVLQAHPYYRLLRMYLDYFLPRTPVAGSWSAAQQKQQQDGSSSMGRMSGLLTSSSGVASRYSAGSAGGAYMGYMGGGGGSGMLGAGAGTMGQLLSMNQAVGGAGSGAAYPASNTSPDSQGGVVLSILVEFWLTDVSEPLPQDVDKAAATAATAAGGVTGVPGMSVALSPSSAPSPAAAAAAAAASAGASSAPSRLLSYQPPSDELVEGLMVLMRHIHVVQETTAGQRQPGTKTQQQQVSLQPAQACRVPWLPETPLKTAPLPPPRLLVPPPVMLERCTSATPAVQSVSRKVYRVLRRAFALWPNTSGSASLTPLINLWLAVIAPWQPPSTRRQQEQQQQQATEIAQLGAMLVSEAAAKLHISPPGHGLQGGSSAAWQQQQQQQQALGGGQQVDNNNKAVGGYTPAWRGHVLAHLPFYLQLVPQFMALTLSRMQYKPDTALRDAQRVLAALAACPGLLAELRQVEAALNNHLRPGRRSEGEYAEMLAWWAEQAADCEAAAAAGSGAGALQVQVQGPSGPSSSATSSALAPDVYGRLFTTDERSAAFSACLVLRAAETQAKPELISMLRSAAEAVLPIGQVLLDSRHDGGQSMLAAQQAAVQAAAQEMWAALPRAGRWRNVTYHGDPLLKPIASYEIGLLVRPLVALSRRLNTWLGLDRPWSPAEADEDPPEHMGQVLLVWARKRGCRVNLRFLAEVQTLAWLAGLLLAYYFFAWLMAAPQPLPSGQAGGVTAAAAAQHQQQQHHTHQQQYYAQHQHAYQQQQQQPRYQQQQQYQQPQRSAGQPAYEQYHYT